MRAAFFQSPLIRFELCGAYAAQFVVVKLEAHILVIDLHPCDGEGEGLCRILQNSTLFTSVIRHVTPDASGAAGQKQMLAACGVEFKPSIVFLVSSNTNTGLADLLTRTTEEFGCCVFAVVDTASSQETVVLLQAGAVDVFSPPLTSRDLLPRVWRQLDHTARRSLRSYSLTENLGLRSLVGEAGVFLEAVRKIPVAAGCDASVLITGETGTGKELFARAIHYLSARARRPFIAVNCGAIPTDLVENELFGHAAGAYTGATASHAGLVAESEGGTLFLDEIDCLPLLAQVKLLRFLQDREFRPLGSARLRKADVRVIAATNVCPENALRERRLRHDLYYRLNVLPVQIPPLRARRIDIPLLASHFLKKYAVEFDKVALTFHPDAIAALTNYDWPGNVREFEHVVERAVLLCEEACIGPTQIVLPVAAAPHAISFREAKAREVDQFERRYIEDLLDTHGGNISQAARAAQKNRRAFFELMRKHGLSRTNHHLV